MTLALPFTHIVNTSDFRGRTAAFLRSLRLGVDTSYAPKADLLRHQADARPLKTKDALEGTNRKPSTWHLIINP